MDANVVIKLLAGNAGIHAHLQACSVEDVGIPAVAAHEVFYGAVKSIHRERNLPRALALRFEIVDFDAGAAMHAAKLRVALESAGMMIGPYDLLIAGQALARNLILVTHNTREFRRVAGLEIEDWQS